MTRAAYTGHEALTFTGYLDLESGKTLHAEPGGTYDIAPASGHAGPEVPEPWFTPLQDEVAVPEGGTATPASGEDADGEHDDEGPGDRGEHSAF